MPKRFLEAASPKARALQRQKLGTLRELTVQPATRKRYDAAVNGFLAYLKSNSLTLPHQKHLLDPLVCDYLEHLWSTGKGRGLASDTLAGLQDTLPKLRGSLPGSWRLLKTWSQNEIPNRAPPLPEHVVWAMCGWAAFHGHFSFAISLLVAFYGMLRTGEVLAVQRRHICSQPGSRKVLLSLGLTKSGKRAGAAESVVLGHDTVVIPLKHWMSIASLDQRLCYSPALWRKTFNDALTALKLQDYQFRPYSLRRGGATWWFSKHHSLDQILIQGRWTAAKTARIYLNEGLAVLAELQIPRNGSNISPFLRMFETQLRSPVFATLEPPSKVGRTGGRGKKSQKSNKRKFSGKKGLSFSCEFLGTVPG